VVPQADARHALDGIVELEQPLMQPESPPPLISIIMPTYNRAPWILESVTSILNQSYPHLELIIVDDGSDDQTESIISTIQDERVHFHKAGRIGILGRIKNIGLEKAKGSFIAFMDSDDLWAPEILEKQFNALQLFPEAGFCVTNGYNFITADEPLDHFFRKTDGISCENILIPLFRGEATVFTQALLLRKECLATSGKFREAKPVSDGDFIVSLARFYKAVVIYEPLFFRRIHDTNRIHANWEASYSEGIAIIEEYAAQELLPPVVVHDAFFRLYMQFGEKYLRLGKRKNAIIQFLKAWRNKPFHPAPFRKTAKAILYYFKAAASR
jgi:glycosyltransferase involved in cell wall biosynthesis